MPARLVQVTLINSSDSPITWQDDGRPHGFWQDPWYPSNIQNLKKGESATWRMESGGIMTGVEGWVSFKVDNPLAANVGETELIGLWWERPYIGHFDRRILTPRSEKPHLPRKTAVVERGIAQLGEQEGILGRILTGGALVPLTIPVVFANDLAGTHIWWVLEVRNVGESSTSESLVTPRSEPFVSDLDSSVSDVRSNVAEVGTFESTNENGSFCRQGLWTYKRVFHEQVMTASVEIIKGVNVQWSIDGIPITDNSGTLSISAFCKWPFPLPNGYSVNRVVHVRYEVTNEEKKSTLRIFNDPADGTYSLSIVMKSSFDRKYHSAFTSYKFSGETCDFDPEKLAEERECLRIFSDVSREKAKSKPLKPGDPVIIFPEEIWRFVGEEKRGTSTPLMEIMINSFHNDSETFTRAANQLEQEIGLAGITRLIKIGLP